MADRRENRSAVKFNWHRNRGYFTFPAAKYQMKDKESSKESSQIPQDMLSSTEQTNVSLFFPEGS